MIIIQFITVHWTKASRGAPEAAQRNAVAEAFPLPSNLSFVPDGLILHELNVYETQQFQKAHETIKDRVDAAYLRDLNIEFGVTDDQCAVFYWGDIKRPSHPRKQVFTLEKGEYGRIISNGRFACGESMWCYQKHVYNIYFGQTQPTTSHFQANQPNTIYKDEVHLF